MPDPNTNWNNPVSSSPDEAASNVQNAAPQAAPPVVSKQPTAQPVAPVAAPAPAPAAQPAPAHPNTMAPDDRHSWAMGKAYKSVMNGLSGGGEVSYAVNPDTGKMEKTITPNKPGAAWRKIIASALVGLSAGAETPVRPGAESLSGFGAGVGAQMAQSRQQDAQKRQQASEDFERDQQKIMQKANIAHLNSATLTNYFQQVKAGNDMNPEFDNNKKLVDELSTAGIGAQVMTSEEAKALLSSDSNAKVGAADTIATHFVLPLGREPIMVNGQPALDPKTGQPLTQMMVAAVNGMPDGKIPVTPALQSDIKKYLQYSGVPVGSDIEDGKELEPKQYVSLLRAVQAGKAKVSEGEAHPITAMVDGKLTYVNPVTGTPVANLKNVTPNAEDKVAGQKSTLAKNAAETNKANAEASKARADIISDDDLTAVADAVYRGDMDLTKVTSMRSNQRTKLAELIESRHPDFNMQNYATQLGTMKDFTSGKTSQNITALNTSIGHLDQLYQAANALNNGNVQVLNHVANSLGVQIGESPVATYAAIHNAVSGEVSKTFKGASATDQELQAMDKTFSPSQSPKQAKAALDATIRLFASRLDALNNQFRNGTGKNASERGIMLISPESQAVLQRHGFNFGSNGASAAPAGQVQVQIPGQPAGFIPQNQVAAFKQKHPDAVVSQ